MNKEAETSEANRSTSNEKQERGSPFTSHVGDAMSQEGLELYRHYTREDRYLGWFYRPHTLTMLSICGIILIYAALFETPNINIEQRIKRGLGAGSFVFLLFAALQFKDGLFVRPHPVIWRIVTGLGILYLLLLVFILFQSVDDVRWLLSKVDPNLGYALPERTYASNCDWNNFVDALYDEFMIAHFLGWFGKAFLFRDWYLCWVMSILFEFLEISLEHMLPNFGECWWDHVILDVFGMNFFGFSLGMWVLNKYSMKSFSWIKPIATLDKYQWSILSGPKRLIAVVGLIIVINQIELNAFFMKTILWVPPPHILNVIRLILWWAIGLAGTREYYQYCTDKNCKKLGPMSWLCVANMGMEVLICIKFGKGMFPKPAPTYIVVGWTFFILVFVLWAVTYYGYQAYKNTLKNKKN